MIFRGHDFACRSRSMLYKIMPPQQAKRLPASRNPAKCHRSSRKDHIDDPIVVVMVDKAMHWLFFV